MKQRLMPNGYDIPISGDSACDMSGARTVASYLAWASALLVLTEKGNAKASDCRMGNSTVSRAIFVNSQSLINSPRGAGQEKNNTMKRLIYFIILTITSVLGSTTATAAGTDSDPKIWIEQDGTQPRCARFWVRTAAPLSQESIIKVCAGDEELTRTTNGYYVAGIHGYDDCKTITVSYLNEENNEETITGIVYEGDVKATISNGRSGSNFEEAAWVEFTLVIKFDGLGPKCLPSGISPQVAIVDDLGPFAEVLSLGYNEDGRRYRIRGLYPRKGWRRYGRYYRYPVYLAASIRWDDRTSDSSLELENKIIEMDEGLKLSYTTTATTMTITDSNLPKNSYRFINSKYADSDNEPFSEDNPVVLRNLRPGHSYALSCTYNGRYVHIVDSSSDYAYITFTHPALKIPHNFTEVSPTSVRVSRGSFNRSDLNIKDIKWSTPNPVIVDENTAYFTGLQPGLQPDDAVWLGTVLTCEDINGEYELSTGGYVVTPPLDITTLQPNNTSATTAVVRAEINAADVEPNVGFQWKKYDAPASLAPSEGYAAIYGNAMEGYIRNLQPTSYYNVRAFYKTNEGRYYYGDWVTFDPSDFSYFEPTVHTYGVNQVTSNSASARGYAMPGSDDIEQQGFEYWATGSLQNTPQRVMVAAAAGPQATTVFSTGQVMTASLTNLLPDTEYVVRSFVKTSAGSYYGEEQQFRTEQDAGLSNISCDNVPAVPVAYYTLTGICSPTPHNGLNIVVYSDGHAEKVVIRR